MSRRATALPNNVPGEVRLLISLDDPPAAGQPLPARILARIEELRPAGVRVITEAAGSVSLQVRVELVLAGSHQSPSEISNIRAQAQATIIETISKTGVGQKVRLRPLVSAILGDQRIVDAVVTVGEKGQALPQPGEDFTPPAGAIVTKPGPEDIVFGSETFDEQLPASGGAVAIEVRAVLGVTPAAGIALDTVKARITERLNTFFSNLTAGGEVTSDTLLTALRDDAKYTIDPLRMLVTLTTAEQFVQVAQGGQSFTAAGNQTFTVVSVEVTP